MHEHAIGRAEGDEAEQLGRRGHWGAPREWWGRRAAAWAAATRGADSILAAVLRVDLVDERGLVGGVLEERRELLRDGRLLLLDRELRVLGGEALDQSRGLVERGRRRLADQQVEVGDERRELGRVVAGQALRGEVGHRSLRGIGRCGRLRELAGRLARRRLRREERRDDVLLGLDAEQRPQRRSGAVDQRIAAGADRRRVGLQRLEEHDRQQLHLREPVGALLPVRRARRRPS